jgi:hypothetical protein
MATLALSLFPLLFQRELPRLRQNHTSFPRR